VHAISRWASNSERQAKYVLFPKNAQAVALAIIFATDNKLSLAIRGGGHSVSGSSSVQDGVVIDLSRFLNGVVIDPFLKLAFVAGGATWVTVEKAAIEHGLATVAGTVNETGVGGLTLGGGWGFLTGEHGLSLDNLKEVTIVTASGSILTASSNSHPDLFWGIRGGGCNFGVVTQFVFTLHPQRSTVFGGALVFQPAMLERLVNTAVQWWHNADPKAAGSLIIGRFPYTPTPTLIWSFFYNGSAEEGKTKFKQFYDIGPLIDLTREMPFEHLNAQQNASFPPGLVYYTKAMWWRTITVPFVSAALQLYDQYTTLNPVLSGTALAFEFFPVKKVNSVPPEETAFPRRGREGGNFLLLAKWPKETGYDMLGVVRKLARELGVLLVAEQGEEAEIGYSNFCERYIFSMHQENQENS